MRSSDIRHHHLIRILADVGGSDALAKRLGVTPSYISQLKNRNRNLGDTIARRIESEFGLPLGYMDTMPADTLSDISVELSRMTDTEALEAIRSALPSLSDASVRRLAMDLLAQLAEGEAPQE